MRVSVGIDAAITAKHHVAVRETAVDGSVTKRRFVVPPTLAGLSQLTRRVARSSGVVAVAEPTSMTWLSLALSLEAGGGRLAATAYWERLYGDDALLISLPGMDRSPLRRCGRSWVMVPASTAAGRSPTRP